MFFCFSYCTIIETLITFSEGIMKFFSAILQKGCIKAVLFDIFGTVVDWRGTMVKEFIGLFNHKGIIGVDCEEFVEIWVSAYSKNMHEISAGNRSFALVDELNIIALNETLLKYNIADKFTQEEAEQMWMIWHRLDPWPDSVFGINELKKQFKTGTLSNGNIQLLEDLSKKQSSNGVLLYQMNIFVVINQTHWSTKMRLKN